MEIYIDNIKLEAAAGEKLLGVVIDSNPHGIYTSTL